MQPRLIASDLACRRGDRILARGVSFELGAGEALHVTGANGIGKTTLIRTLAGLTSPFAGKMSREGKIALLNDRPALDPDLALGRAIQFWARIDRAGNPDIATTDLLGLTPLLDVPVRYLSTGQTKRAAMAVVIGSGSAIWLLDEPLSGLDSGAIEVVTQQIERHLTNGGIALVASHQQLAISGLETLALGDYAPRASLPEEVAE